MAYGIDVSNILGAFSQLQQSNAANRARKEAAANRRRSGISAITTTAGSIIGGVYGGPMGAAAGGAIGGAVGGMVGGQPMSEQQVAQHGMNIYGSYQNQQAMEQKQQQAEAQTPVRTEIQPQKIDGATVYKEFKYNAAGEKIGTGEIVPPSKMQLDTAEPEVEEVPVTVLTEGENALQTLQSVDLPMMTEDRQNAINTVQNLMKPGKGSERSRIAGIEKAVSKIMAPPPEKAKTLPTYEVYIDGKKQRVQYNQETDTYMMGAKAVPKNSISLDEPTAAEKPQKAEVYYNGRKRRAVYNPQTDTYKIGKDTVSAKEVGLEDNIKWEPLPADSPLASKLRPGTAALVNQRGDVKVIDRGLLPQQSAQVSMLVEGTKGTDSALNFLMNEDGSINADNVKALQSPITPSYARNAMADLNRAIRNRLRIESGAVLNEGEIKEAADQYIGSLMLDDDETMVRRVATLNKFFTDSIDIYRGDVNSLNDLGKNRGLTQELIALNPGQKWARKLKSPGGSQSKKTEKGVTTEKRKKAAGILEMLFD